MKKFTVHAIVIAAMVAALYCVLTLSVASFGYGPVQLRVSEALTVLPMFTPAAIPGLFIGCALANMLGSSIGWMDVIFGSLASLLAAYLTWRLRGKSVWIALIPPIVVNAVVIGILLHFAENLPLLPTMLSVGCGQVVSCYVLGVPLYYALRNANSVKSLFRRESGK